jgi:hypothetical protein
MVSRWMPSLRAISRCDYRLAAEVKMECCRLTLSVLIASLGNVRSTQPNTHFRWPVLNCPSPAGFNYPLTLIGLFFFRNHPDHINRRPLQKCRQTGRGALLRQKPQ